MSELHNLQSRTVAWGLRCFGLHQMASARIRGLRLLEEAIEYAQSVGIEPDKARELLDYVYGRPVGDPLQELGGVGVTALAAAGSLGVQLADVTETEISRVESKTPEHFATRNDAKVKLGFK